MRKYFRSAAAFLTAMSLLIICGCNGGTIKETEGNNSFATANVIELQKEVEGYLQVPDDRDYFSFEVKHRAVLDVGLSGIKGINHSIKIWKNSDQPVLLKLVDDTRKSSPERMNNLTVDPGTYFISVQHGEGDRKKGNSETPYKLRISYRDFLNEEAEPNDNPVQATAIEAGQEISGYCSPAYNRLNAGTENQYREEDWFSLHLECEEGKPLLLDVMLTGVPGINSVLAVYDPDRQLIMELDNNPSGQGEEIKGLGITRSGTYYVMVTARGHNANFDSSYFLLANTRGYDPSMELEPNNTMESATEMTRNIMRGNINSPGDEDFFRYRGNGINTVYRVSLVPDENNDVSLTIYSSAGKKMLDINNGGTGEAEVFPDLSSVGEFYCRVSMGGSGAAPDNSYELSIEPLENIRNLESEPNDSKEKATTVTDSEVRGYISKAKDRDYFYLKFNRRVNLELSVKGVRDGVIKLSVTDPLGYVLKSRTVRGDSVETLSEMIDGRGYLIVEAVENNFDNPYEIEVKKK